MGDVWIFLGSGSEFGNCAYMYFYIETGSFFSNYFKHLKIWKITQQILTSVMQTICREANWEACLQVGYPINGHSKQVCEREWAYLSGQS